MARIRGQKRNRKTQEKADLNAPLPSPGAPINPSSDWWENFSRRFSGYPPDSLFKVSRKTFEYICGLVKEEMMTGQNCTDLRREYLMLNDRVAMALTRLSTGESLDAIGNMFRVSISTVSLITWRFVEAIEKKGFHHLHWPKTEEQIMEIKSKFERIRGLPNCCGAIDTTKIMFCLSSDHAHRKIWRDSENDACMILQAVVDPDMRFLDIIAGLPGSLSEPDVLCEWSLFNLCEERKRLNGKKLKLAENKEEIGEYIVGSGGFPLLPWLLTPYKQEKKLCDVKEDFNKRHYVTWKVAKMAFERLKENWQIIQGVLWTPDKHKLPRIIYACCVLHNIMIEQKDGFIMQDQSFLQSDDNSPQVHQQKCKFRDKTASFQRDNLALYLSTLPPFSSNGFESVSRLAVLTDFQPPTDTTVVGRGKALPSEKGESAARAVGHSILAEVEATHAKKASKNEGKGLAVADPVEEEGAAARAKLEEKEEEKSSNKTKKTIADKVGKSEEAGAENSKVEEKDKVLKTEKDNIGLREKILTTMEKNRNESKELLNKFENMTRTCSDVLNEVRKTKIEAEARKTQTQERFLNITNNLHDRLHIMEKALKDFVVAQTILASNQQVMNSVLRNILSKDKANKGEEENEVLKVNTEHMEDVLGNVDEKMQELEKGQI